MIQLLSVWAPVREGLHQALAETGWQKTGQGQFFLSFPRVSTCNVIAVPRPSGFNKTISCALSTRWIFQG